MYFQRNVVGVSWEIIVSKAEAGLCLAGWKVPELSTIRLLTGGHMKPISLMLYTNRNFVPRCAGVRGLDSPREKSVHLKKKKN